jgi:hypothetical protein
MSELDFVMADNRAAVDGLIAAAHRCEPAWTDPWAPGKWSPSQIVEHVAMSLEEGGNVVSERPAKLPSLPFFLRPLARMLLKRAVRKGHIPNARTNKAMNPGVGPASVEAGEQRLRGAMDAFERDCRARIEIDPMCASSAFGHISVEDYARFVALHTRHHTKQMPVVL